MTTHQPAIALLALTLLTLLPGCGERIPPARLDELSRATADVLAAIQRTGDSTSRMRIADSVARRHGFDDWRELREEIGVIATEPERLRALLDSTQNRLEARTK